MSEKQHTLLSLDRIHAYRDDTYRRSPALRLKDVEQALEFVDQRGFVYLWPIKEIEMPSLWAAVAGKRQVASEHDDPGHVTWGWKDSMLDKRRWYYAKVLRKRATVISLDIAPYFYALTENFGSPEEDYLAQYEAGLMTHEARRIYEMLLDQGPLDTVNLRRTLHMTSKQSNSPFNRAMTYLQQDFKILPVGIAETGAWRYSFIYDIVARHYPAIPEAARAIGERQARRRLVDCYLRSVGAEPLRQVAKVFQWRKRELERTLEELVQAGAVRRGLTVEGDKDEWIGLPAVSE